MHQRQWRTDPMISKELRRQAAILAMRIEIDITGDPDGTIAKIRNEILLAPGSEDHLSILEERRRSE